MVHKFILNPIYVCSAPAMLVPFMSGMSDLNAQCPELLCLHTYPIHTSIRRTHNGTKLMLPKQETTRRDFQLANDE